MCGIFGAIGDHINPGIIRALAIANRARGKDSLGLFSNTGKFVKSAGDPMDSLGNGAFDEFIEKTCCKGWFLAGHTRYATHGTITSRNAHPFRYGRIIGCHNGIVDIPLDSPYKVDSEILFDRLNQHNGDYQTAFADLDGYWALAWFDGESFYLQAHDNEVWIGRDKSGTWYYSSDCNHLVAAAGKLDCVECLSWGRTIRFDVKCRKYESCPDFVSAFYDDWTGWKEETEEEARAANPYYDDFEEGDRWARFADFDAYTKQYDNPER